MEKQLDGMERWGVEAILKESARLLCKHHRLFLPFYLAFYLPISIAGIFPTVFLAPLHYASFITSIFTTAQGGELGTDTGGGKLVLWIVFSALLLAIYVLVTLGQGALAYIVAYIYSNGDSDDDRSIVEKVFKLLPHAFLRMWVTQLWTVLPLLLLYIFTSMVCGMFYAITSSVTTWSDSRVPTYSALVPILGAVPTSISLTIIFAFALFVAVLEPGKYGREALKRSTKLVYAGKASTIFAVFLIGIIYSLVVLSYPFAISWTLPLWKEIILHSFIGILNSAFGAYLGVVSVVTYFVYTSRFDAVSSSISEFQRHIFTASPENLYKPLVPGDVYTTSIGKK